MFEDLYNREVTLTRATAAILDEVAAGQTLTPDRQPSKSAFISLGVSGNSTAGIIRVIGSLAGTPVAENIAVDSAGYSALSVNRFDAVTSFLVSGMTTGTISADQVEGQGEPILQEVFIKTLWAAVVAKSGRLRALEAGNVDQSKYVMATAADSEIRSLPETFVYVMFEGMGVHKFRITFATPPGRMGNMNSDLSLTARDVEIPT